MRPIQEIAKTAGVPEEYLEYYGRYKAKIDYRLLRETEGAQRKADPGHRHQPHPRRGGKDHHHRGSG